MKTEWYFIKIYNNCKYKICVTLYTIVETIRIYM